MQTEHATQIVAAYITTHQIAAETLPGLIRAVIAAFEPAPPVAEPEMRPDPAVPVKKSVQHDYIVCLEDGKKLKMLKRYLQSRYNMTPEQYRERWGLPADYPMVAPAYSERRSGLAKSIGLGKLPVHRAAA